MRAGIISSYLLKRRSERHSEAVDKEELYRYLHL